MRKRLLLILVAILILLLGIGGYIYWKRIYIPQQAEEALAIAQTYADSGRYDLALPYAQEAADFFPDRFQAQHLQALALLKTGGDTLQAIEYLGRAYTLAPAEYNNALLYSLLTRKFNNAERSLEVLSELIDTHSDSAELFFQRAITRAALADLDSSYIDYTHGVELEGVNEETLLQRFSHQERMAAFAEVISALAREDDPGSNSAEACAQRGLFRVKIQDFSHAIKDFHEAISKGLARGEVFYGLSISYMNVGKLDSALQYASRALEFSAKPDSILQLRALIAIRSNQPKLAVEDLTKLINSGSKKANTYYLRGIAHTQLAQNKAAIQDYTRTIELRPTLNEAYFNRGLAYSYNEDFTHAIEDYNVVIERMPNWVEPYFARGVAYINMDMFNEGCVDLRHAASMGYEQAEDMLDTYCAHL